MKATELRIGSTYLSTKFGVPVTLELADFDELYHRCEGAEIDEEVIDSLVKPIPLTEEWLLKFGFDKANRINVDLMSKTPVWANHSFSITIWGDGSLFYDWMGGNIEVKYVHQLQNIYSALTGEELKA